MVTLTHLAAMHDGAHFPEVSPALVVTHLRHIWQSDGEVYNYSP